MRLELCQRCPLDASKGFDLVSVLAMVLVSCLLVLFDGQ
jgi:hypothetical protein